MRSLLVATALVAATASAASAGTYLGLGIGTAASGHVGDDTSSMSSAGDRSGRLFLGFRFGHLSIEGGVMRYTQFFKATRDDATQLGADLKYSLPLGNGFEAFGRGGIQRTQLSNDNAEIAGAGWLLGAGFEYRLNLGVTAASLFIDYTHTQTSFDQGSTGGMTSIDSSASMWMAGATLAL